MPLNEYTHIRDTTLEVQSLGLTYVLVTQEEKKQNVKICEMVVLVTEITVLLSKVLK